MANQNVNVSSQTMQNAVQRLQQTYEHNRAKREQTTQTIANLMSIWGGNAAVAFSRAMDNWLQNIDTVQNALLEMIEIMGGNIQQYVAQEQAADDAANQLAATLAT
ncbi:MAG: WXG100 family type VII secretion target [Actinomycetota bacterium]